MVESGKPTVVLTGVTGYIGAWVAKLFLEDGGFHVVGTVRDKDNAKRLEPLKSGLGEELFAKLELRSADLL